MKQSDIDRMNEFFETHHYDRLPKGVPEVEDTDDDDTEADVYGAGIAFVTPDRHVLLLKRGADGDHVGEWCFPGGRIEDGETPEEAARREAKEEAGPVPDGKLDFVLAHANSDGVHYTTYRQNVSKFTPKLNAEHVAFTWAPIDDLPQSLHPGVTRVLDCMDKE